jgi:hypothetical protein
MSNIFKKNALNVWMAKATPTEKNRLAELAFTTLGTLQQISGGYRTEGLASTKPELARNLEAASVVLVRVGLPAMKREDLCPSCGACDLAQEARNPPEGDESLV